MHLLLYNYKRQIYSYSQFCEFHRDDSTLKPMSDDDLRDTDGIMKGSAALFLMKVKTEGRLTQSALRDITNGASSLCQLVFK